MDRSRSPHRPPSQVAGNRPFPNFPVRSGPNTSDNLPRGQGLQTGQAHWTPGHQGFQPSQGISLTQSSQQIPPGQVGNSQPYLGMSQQSRHAAPNQSWGPNFGTPAGPRPQVQGLGLGGIVPAFPPTPPTWTSTQFPGNPRLPQYGHGTPSSQRPTQVSPPSRSTCSRAVPRLQERI